MSKTQPFLAEICEKKTQKKNTNSKNKRVNEFYSQKYVNIKSEVDKVMQLKVGTIYKIIIEEVEGVNYE